MFDTEVAASAQDMELFVNWIAIAWFMLAANCEKAVVMLSNI